MLIIHLVIPAKAGMLAGGSQTQMESRKINACEQRSHPCFAATLITSPSATHPCPRWRYAAGLEPISRVKLRLKADRVVKPHAWAIWLMLRLVVSISDAA